MPEKPLFDSIRILDLTQGIAGPYASKLLLDQGADVLEVEDASRIDPIRTRTATGATIPAGEDPAFYRFLHAGKRNTTVEEEGLRAIAEQADVVLEDDEAYGLAARSGLSLEAWHERHPALVIVSISPWGRTGPFADRPATEWTLQAATGFMARRGRPELGHIGAGGRLGEFAAGSFAALAALAALREASRDGRGRHVDLSIFESMLVCSTQYWDLDYQLSRGELGQYLDIPAVEPAKDGWVGFSPQTSEQWQNFCLLIDRPEIALDDRFLTANTRQAHLEFLHDAIHSWTRARTIEEILIAAEALRVPASPVGNGELLPQVDHFRTRGVFVSNPHGFIQPRPPFRIGDFDRRAIRPTPARGTDAPTWRPRETRGLSVAPTPAKDGAFAGLRVVDLTAFWAGPFASFTMAQFGADAIKVESIMRPDGMRFVNAKPDVPIWEGGAIFHGANPDKRGITLALDREEGRDILRQLVERADILIENFSARVLGNLDLAPETLLAWNPRLVIVRMPAWGLDGPWADRPGFAMNVEQASGIAWRAGYSNQPLTANYCDPVGAVHALVATFAALEEVARTGRGTVVEAPLTEPALNLAAEQIVEYSAYGVRLDSEGNRCRNVAPQGIYACADGGHVAIAVRSGTEWAALARSLGARSGSEELAALADDAELADLEARRARHDALDAAIGRATAALDAASVAETLTAAGVPAERLINGYHLMPHAQLEHRRFTHPLDHPLTGRARYPGLPFVGLADQGPSAPPPTLGQHNREVLIGELGIDEARFAELESQGVLGTKPPWA